MSLNRKFMSSIGSLLALLIGFPSFCVPAAAQPGSSVGEGVARYQDGLRKWTVQDSLAVRYFAPEELPPFRYRTKASNVWPDPIKRSPDGKYFFIITFRGDLACDCNEYGLEVFSSDAVQKALASHKSSDAASMPVRNIVLRSGRPERHYDGISNAHWENERSILFVGVRGKGPRQLFRLDVPSGELKRLTDEQHDVEFEGYQFQGNTLVYTALTVQRSTRQEQYPSITLDQDKYWDWVSGDEKTYTKYSSVEGSPAKAIQGMEGMSFMQPFLSISPNGRWAMMLMPPSREFPIPESWQAYAARSSLREADQVRFALVDLTSGRSRLVFDAPAGWATLAPEAQWSKVLPDYRRVITTQKFPSVLWKEDSQHAVLVYTALPLDEKNPERRNTAYIVDYEIATGNWSVIEPVAPTPGPPYIAGWIEKGKEFLVTHTNAKGEATAGTVYRLQGNRWIGRPEPASTQLVYDYETRQPRASTVKASKPKTKTVWPKGLSVTVRQSVNNPPVVVATRGGKTLTLIEEDPALKGIWRAPVQEVHWTEPDGKTVTGGLMLPRDSEHLKPLPVVIQAYSYYPDRFLPDGAAVTAFAAQPLAAQGIAVLQMNLAYIDHEDVMIYSPKNSELFAQRIDAAVEELAKQGVIDPKRIGFNGFLVSARDNYALITHPKKTTPAAVVLAYPHSSGLSAYLRSQDYPAGAMDYLFGGSATDFFQDKAGWLERGLELNADRIQAPVLFMETTTTSFVDAFEARNALRMNRRPVESLIFPGGTSWNLNRPRQREASLIAAVDWFNFWLQNKEDPDSAKAEKYLRWRKMKADWAQVQPQIAGG